MSCYDVSSLGEEKSTEDILKNLEDKPLQVDIPQTVLMKMDEADEYGKNSVSIILHYLSICPYYLSITVYHVSIILQTLTMLRLKHLLMSSLQ